MSEHFNGLLPAEAERLALLAEECGEIIQEVGKILRHGYDDKNPNGDGGTNRMHLAYEIGDLNEVIARMSENGDIDPDISIEASHRKHEKLKRWTHHQRDSILSAQRTTP